MLCMADECLDDDGKVLYGKKKVIDSWEQKTSVHFIHNSLFSLADDVGLQVSRCYDNSAKIIGENVL